MNITLVRHTRVDNKQNICYGNFDIDIAESFMNEQKKIQKKLTGTQFHHVYSSPLQRCSKLANACFPDQNIINDDRLKELNFGTWEGKTWKSLSEESKEFYDTFSIYKSFQNGESFQDLLDRISDFIEFCKKKHANQHIIIFTHGGPIRAFMSILQNIQPLQALEQSVVYGQIFNFTIH